MAQWASELDQGSPQYALWPAGPLVDLGEVPEANRLIEGVVRRWPHDWWIPGAAAWVYATVGDSKGAVQSARRALEIDPKDTSGLLVLAIADLNSGKASAARARYAKEYPDLLAPEPPQIDGSNVVTAVNLALILQETGDEERASQLLDGSERAIRPNTRLGVAGYGITDVRSLPAHERGAGRATCSNQV